MVKVVTWGNTDMLFRPGYGNKNKMVRLCRAIDHIQRTSPIKGKRRYGRRILNVNYQKFYDERNAELEARGFPFKEGRLYRVTFNG